MTDIIWKRRQLSYNWGLYANDGILAMGLETTINTLYSMRITLVKKYLLPMALGLVLGSGNAAAAFINGSISFVDGFDTLPAAPTNAIVSDLVSFDVGAVAGNFGSGTGDFSTVGSLNTAYDFDITSLPTDIYLSDNGFTFQLISVSNVSRTALACSNGLCNDDISFDISGSVSGLGFDTTEFQGTWTAQGSCAGDAGECTADISASWSASLTALGVAAPPPPPQGVPEPGVLALLGLGLMGTMGLRRRKQA